MVFYFKKKKLFLVLGVIVAFVFILQSNFLWQLFYPIKYRDLIREYSLKNGLDPFLVAAIIRTESKFEPKVVSKRGARGLMQIMPDTGEWIAEQMKIKEFDSEELFDEETNIKLGTWYLANLKQKFNDEVIVLAAYNAGRGNVRRWLSTGEWSGERKALDALPFPETKEYVKKVLNYQETYQQVYEGNF